MVVNDNDGGEGGEDMYCFRCKDREGDLQTDVWVHVDIAWEEFAAKLARTFGRAVTLVYRREGESQEVKVQAEMEFEDLCEYLDNTQIHTLHAEVRTARRRRVGGGSGEGDDMYDVEASLSPAPGAAAAGL
eukprot:CAMPEP_0174923724 /NCGR_PEP_ID=MMETSP1355-20121228/6780_1 /TAXON_ID=464990 /ORGANISM="Hemiselmis tepida, Strain CCMP443" /LENGTH=130 /DNA_ID=CAMNT_0016169445 /DNA_START=214 /DNA_END=603 /DNA_ORIENTATION=-